MCLCCQPKIEGVLVEFLACVVACETVLITILLAPGDLLAIAIDTILICFMIELIADKSVL